MHWYAETDWRSERRDYIYVFCDCSEGWEGEGSCVCPHVTRATNGANRKWILTSWTLDRCLHKLQETPVQRREREERAERERGEWGERRERERETLMVSCWILVTGIVLSSIEWALGDLRGQSSEWQIWARHRFPLTASAAQNVCTIAIVCWCHSSSYRCCLSSRRALIATARRHCFSARGKKSLKKKKKKKGGGGGGEGGVEESGWGD